MTLSSFASRAALGLSAALLLATGASAQSASEIYAYRAPNGMFGDGTTKWNEMRQLHEDMERTKAWRAANGYDRPAVAAPTESRYAVGPAKRRKAR